MPFYVLIPSEPAGRNRVVIAPYGHGGHGKDDVVGNRTTEGLVKRGFMVFCPYTRGFGERRELRAQGDTDQKSLIHRAMN